MKKKLKINELAVKSFITSLEKTSSGIYGASGNCNDAMLTPVIKSRDVNCAFTRFNNICILN
jgi:hypothetical protein